MVCGCRKNEVTNSIGHMIGHRLVTKQTPTEGVMVEKVMVAESVPISRETYLAILLDRDQNGPVIIASPQGGVDIEQVAEESPHLIFKVRFLKLNCLSSPCKRMWLRKLSCFKFPFFCVFRSQWTYIRGCRWTQPKIWRQS